MPLGHEVCRKNLSGPGRKGPMMKSKKLSCGSLGHAELGVFSDLSQLLCSCHPKRHPSPLEPEALNFHITVQPITVRVDGLSSELDSGHGQ